MLVQRSFRRAAARLQKRDRTYRLSRQAALLLPLVTSLLFLLLGTFGCSKDAATVSTPGVVPPVMPKRANLSTPESAVESYADWISYAYRVLDSEVASHTFTPFEEVRVNSYVQYNKTEGRAIEQMLAEHQYRRVKSSPSTVTVVGSEYWRYRYIDVRLMNYLTSPADASYEVTYTVVKSEDGAWLVDDVEVTRLDEPEVLE